MASTTRFFYKHAGWSYDPKTETRTQGRWRGARLLAQAEAYARDAFWRFEWAPEWDVDHSWCDCGRDASAHEVYVCFLRSSDGTALQSLGNIFDPSREYRRVVEAELALEAMHIEQAEGASAGVQRRAVRLVGPGRAVNAALALTTMP